MDTKYSTRQALKVVQTIIKDGGGLVLSGHYKKRMLERGVDVRDVLHVIKTGRIPGEPEPHIKTGKWIYTIEGLTLDGVKLKVPVSIYDEEQKVVIVTVMN